MRNSGVILIFFLDDSHSLLTGLPAPLLPLTACSLLGGSLWGSSPSEASQVKSFCDLQAPEILQIHLSPLLPSPVTRATPASPCSLTLAFSPPVVVSAVLSTWKALPADHLMAHISLQFHSSNLLSEALPAPLIKTVSASDTSHPLSLTHVVFSLALVTNTLCVVLIYLVSLTLEYKPMRSKIFICLVQVLGTEQSRVSSAYWVFSKNKLNG